jgi:hypothetical protein
MLLLAPFNLTRNASGTKCSALRPSAQVDAEAIATAIEYTAKILGAAETDFKEMDGWSYFCADEDWLLRSEFQFKSIHKIFNGPGPFPEAKEQNAFRCESLCLAFSSSVYTASNGEVVVLKGSTPSQNVLESHLRELSAWERLVGFKFGR